MNDRIQALSPEIASQIAAGEVIERPASVVKELLENALDSGATSITIDIGYGGLNQIKISDNGRGILAEDLPLAIAAHATSKITQLIDLYAITSMGFRGEALASIASIARLSIASRPAQQIHGMLLEKNDQDIFLTPCARNQGTSVDVRDIFYNAPVRKKFLKTERGEFLLIDALVRRFALSAPQLALQLNHNGKSQLQLPAASDAKSRLHRIGKIMGKTFLDNALHLEVEQSDMRLQGWISNSSYQRSQNDKQYIYINGRMVKDKLLLHAIRQAYDTSLHPGRYSACILYLTMNPAELDVNVHPTKHEVRFQQPRLIHDFICSHLQALLHKNQVDSNYLPVADERRSALILKESYQPLRNLPLPESVLAPVPNASFFMLTPRFIVQKIEQKNYLLDTGILQEHYALKVLRQTTLPFASRPLLVPVYWESGRLSPSVIEKLKQIGIFVDFVNQKCLIRSIPVIAANVQLIGYLQAVIAQEVCTTESLLILLARYSIQDWSSLSQEQQQELLLFAHDLLQTNPRLVREITNDLCLDLLNNDQCVLSDGSDCLR